MTPNPDPLAAPLSAEEIETIRNGQRGRALVCSIDKHERCNGYAPAAAMTPCACHCHGIPQADRWLATLALLRSEAGGEGRNAILDEAMQAVADVPTYHNQQLLMWRSEVLNRLLGLRALPPSPEAAEPGPSGHSPWRDMTPAEWDRAAALAAPSEDQSNDQP